MPSASKALKKWPNSSLTSPEKYASLLSFYNSSCFISIYTTLYQGHDASTEAHLFISSNKQCMAFCENYLLFIPNLQHHTFMVD